MGISQNSFIPLGHSSYHIIDRIEIKSGHTQTNFHTGIKPYTQRTVHQFISTDSLNTTDIDQANLAYIRLNQPLFQAQDSIKSKKALLKYFYQTPSTLYYVKTKDFALQLNPVIYFGYGKDQSQTTYLNTRGVELNGVIDDKVSFIVS